MYVSMCAGLPSRLDLYHDLARVQERVLHLEQENAALRAACASAAAGRSADALECGDGHGEDESLAQEDYGEGTARMEEVPMDEGWMHLKRAVDRDRAFVDFRRFRSSVNAVTINPSDNAFAQYNADLDRGLHNAAQATLRRPGRKILPTSCNAHSKFHLDKHVSLIRGPPTMSTPERKKQAARWRTEAAEDHAKLQKACVVPSSGPLVGELYATKWRGKGAPDFADSMATYWSHPPRLCLRAGCNIRQHGGAPDTNNGTESNHRWLHDELRHRKHGARHCINLLNVIRARSARDEGMSDCLRREVHCAAFYRRVHEGMNIIFKAGEGNDVTISQWDCQVHARIPLEIGFKEALDADEEGKAPTWSLDPEDGHIQKEDTDCILIPSRRTVKDLVMVGPFASRGKGKQGGASGGLAGSPERITAEAIRNLAQDKCRDGSASWVDVFTEMMRDPAAAQEKHQWDFDAFVGWATSFAVLVKVSLCAYTSMSRRVYGSMHIRACPHAYMQLSAGAHILEHVQTRIWNCRRAYTMMTHVVYVGTWCQVEDKEEQCRLLRRLERGIPAAASGISNTMCKPVIDWQSASLQDGIHR